VGTALTGGQIWVGNASNVAAAVAMSGDATLSNAGALTLATVATAGTYRSVTVDVKGRVTAGTNPTTISGYGITDAVSKGGDTMTGTLNLASNGLNVGSGQLVVTGGNVTASGTVQATSFISTSDRRLKEHIESTQGLAIINKLTGVRWDWKDSHQPDAGVIAQELEKVMPNAVVTHPDTGFKAVKYNSLFAPVIQSIKELYRMLKGLVVVTQNHDRAIEELKKENQQLKSENEKLKSDIELIKQKLGLSN
jgi:hypothetical protein